ncbi:MAG TPA: zf-HC2 domain-containing protein, partial [Thermoanaerobaculia bacterium]|nr:zf-HC2 domain-containing protein [Thermoanaerobaculia bacterium]
MRCRSVLTRVDALRTGELPPEEQGQVHEHLKTCRSCDDSLTDLGELASRVKVLVPVPPRSCKDELADTYDRVLDHGNEVWIAFSPHGLRLVYRGSYDQFAAAYAKRYGRCLKSGTLPDALRKQVVSALEGAGVDKPKVDWSDELSPLERDVLGTLTKI